MNFSSWGSGALNHGSFLFYNSTIRRGLDIYMADNCDTVLVTTFLYIPNRVTVCLVCLVWKVNEW